MKDHETRVYPPLPPAPATNAELIAAIEGLRGHLDEVAHRFSVDLEWLSHGLQARLDASRLDALALIEAAAANKR